MRLRSLAAGAVVALAGGALAVLAPMSAPAAGATGKCATITHTTLDGVDLVAEATAALTGKGLRIATPVQASRVLWSKTAGVKMAAVTGLSYRTFKHAGTNAPALPAYVLGIDVDGNGVTDSTLIYEPYYQAGANTGVGAWQSWDVDKGKFWASKTIPGLSNPDSSGSTAGSYAGNRTWAQIREANPDAVISWYGVRLGTWNHVTDATVDEVLFAQRGECSKHVWRDPAKRPTVTFDDACDGSTRVVVSVPAGKGWTVAVDRKGDDVPPKRIDIDGGQQGVHTMPAGDGPVMVWAHKQPGKGHEIEGFRVLGDGRGEWDGGRDWHKVGEHTWSLPEGCQASSGAGSTCTHLNISIANPAKAAGSVEAVLTPGPAGEQSLAVTLKPGESQIVGYDAEQVQQVSVSIGGDEPVMHKWAAPDDCPDGVAPTPDAGSGGGDLPVTGAGVALYSVIGLATVAVGVLVLLAVRARRRSFVA